MKKSRPERYRHNDRMGVGCLIRESISKQDSKDILYLYIHHCTVQLADAVNRDDTYRIIKASKHSTSLNDTQSINQGKERIKLAGLLYSHSVVYYTVNRIRPNQIKTRQQRKHNAGRNMGI